MDRELLLERLERLAIVLDELMPQCAELVRDAIALLKEQQEEIYAIGVELAAANELAEGYAELLKEQERKKGSWDYGTQCSVCKETIIPPKDRKVRVNFCPWCGADMRESYE